MRLVVWVLLLVGCYSATPPAGAPCGPNGECPRTLECIGGFCVDPSTVLISFAAGETLADESSGVVRIPVTLTRPSDDTVLATYAFQDATATNGTDYTGADGTLVFAPGETEKEIELAIVADTVEEPSETFEIVLRDVAGAELGTTTHVVTISGNVLPRVSMAMATSAAGEDAPATLMVVLDAASPVQITVDYTVSGTATSSDFTLTSGTAEFPPGTTTVALDLAVLNDALDEEDETIVVELANPMNALLGAAVTQTHTIVDEDAPPIVAFTMATLTATENSASASMTVSLSAASGRQVTVPFSIGTSSATTGTDFTVGTQSPLVFPPGITSQVIDIGIVADTVDEDHETVRVDLGTPTNASVGIPSAMLTIMDDDLACYGSGIGMVCLDRAPTNGVVLPTSLDTDANPLCAMAQPIGWTAAGQPAACVIAGLTIAQSGSTVVSGTRPLVLVADSTITLAGVLDVASHRGGTTGPGSPSASCAAFPDAPTNGDGAGGGAGGTFMSRGGHGGAGDSGLLDGGNAPNPGAAPTVLRAGCDGQAGGLGANNNQPGAVGRGGGAVYLVAGSSITLQSGAVINASGSGALGGDLRTGGSGAGSGGMIELYAPAVSVGNATLMANGGGGASGGDAQTVGSPGNDPATGSPFTRASGGSGGGATGGAGFAGTLVALSGNTGNASNGGGGGGGGGGFIRSNIALSGATVSAGAIQAP